MRVPRRTGPLAATFAAALAGCAATPKHRVPVGVVLDGDRARIGAIAPDAVAGLALQPFEVPSAPAPAVDDTSAIVAKARSAYVGGEFDACRAELARVDVGKLLAAGQRPLAARAIAFDAACAYGAKAKVESEALATKLATLGLDLPDAPFARDEETLLASAITRVGKAPRHALAVRGPAGARLFVDGRSAGCTLPCATEVPAGDHLVAIESDGHMPASRWVGVAGPTTIAIDAPAASPAVAAAQWRARIGSGQPATDEVGARLLAQLSGQPRIVHLAGGARMTGTLIAGGEIRARGEHAQAVPLIRELAYDAGVLERPAMWQQPKFWIATSIAVAIIAGAIVYAVYEPDVESNLRF